MLIRGAWPRVEHEQQEIRNRLEASSELKVSAEDTRPGPLAPRAYSFEENERMARREAAKAEMAAREAVIVAALGFRVAALERHNYRHARVP